MTSLNATAAASSRGLVSPDCVVLSFRRDGSGVLQLNDSAHEVPSGFPQLAYGRMRTTEEAFRAIGIDAAQIRLVGGTFASTSHVGSLSPPLPTCQLVVEVPGEHAGFSLSEIAAAEFETMPARDVNEAGQVIGTGRLVAGSPQDVPWIWERGQALRLNYVGEAIAIGGDGHVAAALHDAAGDRAAMYRAGHLTEFPLFHGRTGVFGGTDSSAFSVNGHGIVAGQVRSRTEEVAGRFNTRPALFRTGQAPTVLMDLQPEFHSYAKAINERDEVLVLASSGVFQWRSVLWRPKSGRWAYVGDPSRDVHPIAMTDDGVVLGQARNVHGKMIAVICAPGGNWVRLGTEDGWVPVDINNSGDVIGWTWIDQLQRPWLRLSSHDTVLLPYVVEHHTTPHAMNNAGQVVGSAAADHGAHAVIWQR
jgi:uncharacterized membrane protein